MYKVFYKSYNTIPEIPNFFRISRHFDHKNKKCFLYTDDSYKFGYGVFKNDKICVANVLFNTEKEIIEFFKFKLTPCECYSK
jgi:hypothetical protein